MNNNNIIIEYHKQGNSYIPCIETQNKNFKDIYVFFKENIFNKGRKGCYFTNEKHLVLFNDNLIVTWINSKNFIHIIIDNSHYRIDLKNNNLVLADSNYWNLKQIIKNDCVNYNNNTNIYKIEEVRPIKEEFYFNNNEVEVLATEENNNNNNNLGVENMKELANNIKNNGITTLTRIFTKKDENKIIKKILNSNKFKNIYPDVDKEKALDIINSNFVLIASKEDNKNYNRDFIVYDNGSKEVFLYFEAAREKKWSLESEIIEIEAPEAEKQEVQRININNIDAHPFDEFELFCEQMDTRKELIENYIEEYKTIKMVFMNNDYIIISPDFKHNNGYQRTYFTLNNEPLSHMEYNNINELLKDNYITEDLKHIEVFNEKAIEKLNI